jgi:hypothetical protein
MAKRLIHTPGINLERQKYNSISEVDEKAREDVERNQRLNELAMRFQEDKEKIEQQIAMIEASGLDGQDTAETIADLHRDIEKLQAQYEAEVAAEQAAAQAEIQEDLGQMTQIADRFSEQAKSLRDVTMDAADVDTSAAATSADTRRLEVEQMMREYEAQLREQTEEADGIAREILDRHSDQW